MAAKFQNGEIAKMRGKGFVKVIGVYVGKNGPEYDIQIASDGSEDIVLEKILMKVTHENN